MEPHAENTDELSAPTETQCTTQVVSAVPIHNHIMLTQESAPIFSSNEAASASSDVFRTVQSVPLHSTSEILSTGAASASSEELLTDASSEQEMEPDAVVIDILSVATKEKLDVLPQFFRGCCIYTVPNRMKHSNERLYTPRVVSIGPIHYQNEKLMANEYLKEKYLDEFLQLTKVSLNECYEHILKNERKLRKCYADIIKLEKENFAKMILVDAAFLLMILVYTSFRGLLCKGDKLFEKPNMMFDIMYDMLLLENQLPFFILEDLYKLSKLHNILLDRDCHLDYGEEVAMTHFGHEFCMSLRMTAIQREQPILNAVHIIDMLRSYLIPVDFIHEMKKTQSNHMPSTKELHLAGVKIGVGSQKNMFDIKFQHDILRVPPLFIDDYTELIFRNLLAFELCHCNEHIFSSYVEMLRLLTRTSEDTELLIQNGVIENKLANAQQVSTLFQKIENGNMINMSRFLYNDVIDNLIEYHKLDRHKWKATLKQKYFKAPWAICSVSAAILLLVLTIIQTVFTILQVVLPK